MNRSEAMLALGAELKAAVAGADWGRLDRLAADLPGKLAAFAAAGPLHARERRALDLLRAAHDDAAAACARAAREVAARLDEMHNNKEGWMAYALDEEGAPAEDKQ
jgi:hypothetical protein